MKMLRPGRTVIFSPSRPGQLVHESVFTLTLNTNIKPRDLADEQRLSMDIYRVLENTMMTRAGLLYVIGFRPGAPEVGENALISATGNFQVEIGPKYGRLHVHGVIVVRHYSRIFLDRWRILALFRTYGHYPEVQAMPHIHINGGPSEQFAREYLWKSLSLYSGSRSGHP